MKFEGELVEGVLLRRYKRFLADVRFADGRCVTAHCANPGSMKTCLVEGGRVWLSHSSKPSRKLPWTWEIAQVGGSRIYLNPQKSNAIVAEAIRAGVIEELVGYPTIQAEVPWGKSRIDWLLSRPKSRCYVEVKSVTMSLGRGLAAFPDSPTARGSKHVRDLIDIVAAGYRAVLFFAVNRSDARATTVASQIDPIYARTLRQATDCGVEVLAYKSQIRQSGVVISRPIPFFHNEGRMP